jgi:NAD(P)-dependent dehydrogenase (short-subunit alcohol dehydrogenase family)
MGRVDGKVALVTGGALGIGRACAILLAREGAKIAVTDIDEAAGGEVVNTIKGAGGDAIFIRHDAASEDDWRAAVDRTVQTYGKLDIVVNNAGVGKTANVEDQTLEDWRFLMSINLDGVFLGTKYGIEAMKKAGNGGSIINLSSILGIVGDAGTSSYNASKGGVRIFTKSAALHCAKTGTGIRVNSVQPGYIYTPMVANAAGENRDQVFAYLTSLHPIGHLGEPDDIAYGVLYLASDESKFVTGAELVIDGGYTAQ